MDAHSFKNSIRRAYQGIANLTAAPPAIAQLFDPNTTSLAQFFNTLFKTAIVVGAMLAVLRLGYAGFVYMTSDLVSAKTSARDIISNATLGLLLLLAVWLILNQINPSILNLNILQNVKPVPTTQTQGGNQQGGIQKFSTPPAQNSFFGGASGFDPSLNGCGVNGCDPTVQQPVSP